MVIFRWWWLRLILAAKIWTLRVKHANLFEWWKRSHLEGIWFQKSKYSNEAPELKLRNGHLSFRRHSHCSIHTWYYWNSISILKIPVRFLQHREQILWAWYEYDEFVGMGSLQKAPSCCHPIHRVLQRNGRSSKPTNYGKPFSHFLFQYQVAHPAWNNEPRRLFG